MKKPYNISIEINGEKDEIYKVWRRLNKLEYFNSVKCFKMYPSIHENIFTMKCLGYCNRYVIGLYEQDIVDCFIDTKSTSNIILYSFDNLDRMEIEIHEDHSVTHNYYDFYNILNYQYTKDSWDKFVWNCLCSEYFLSEEEIELNYKESFDESFDDEGHIDPDKWFMLKVELYDDLSNNE